MAFWKDREGKELNRQEFMERFKRGVEGITPVQKAKTELFFSGLILFGLIAGLIMTLFKIKTYWWLSIILLAGAGNTTIQIISSYQKYLAFKRVEELKGGVVNGF